MTSAATWRSFLWTLIAGYAVLGTAAGAYTVARHVPTSIALPLALAFLTEFSFYLLPGFSGPREWLRSRWSSRWLAAGMTVTALAPYLVFSIPTGNFGLAQFLAITAILGAVAFCFVTGAGKVRDIAFLALLAAVILSGVLRWIYPAPFPKIPMEVLGHITLVRTAILSVLLVRGAPGTEFGFLPRGRDLTIGLGWFAACAAVTFPLGWWMGQLHWAARAPGVWQSIGVVLGIYWVVALSEEFFFRALLQQWLAAWLNSPAAGLILAAAIFGACHLGGRGPFPNWPYAILAGLLGLFCGAAFRQVGSIRASMVTHALAAGMWRLFFS